MKNKVLGVFYSLVYQRVIFYVNRGALQSRIVVQHDAQQSVKVLQKRCMAKYYSFFNYLYFVIIEDAILNKSACFYEFYSLFIGLGEVKYLQHPKPCFLNKFYAIGLPCLNLLNSFLQQCFSFIGLSIGLGGLNLRYSLSVYGLVPIQQAHPKPIALYALLYLTKYLFLYSCFRSLEVNGISNVLLTNKKKREQQKYYFSLFLILLLFRCYALLNSGLALCISTYIAYCCLLSTNVTVSIFPGIGIPKSIPAGLNLTRAVVVVSAVTSRSSLFLSIRV